MVLYTSGSRVVLHLMKKKEHDQRNLTGRIGDFIGHYVGKNLGYWIEDEGGWVGILNCLQSFEQLIIGETFLL